MSRLNKTAWALAALLAGACSAPQAPRTVPLEPADEAKLSEAAASLGRESYLGFKKAFSLYGELYARPKLRSGVAERYARAGLLFGVRAKELGILNPEPLETVRRLIAENRALAGFQPLLDVADLIVLRSKGVMGDVVSPIESYWDRPRDLKTLLAGLVPRWKSDLLAAYVLAVFRCFYPSQVMGLELEDLTRHYPLSRLLGFVRATSGEMDEAGLRGLLEREPSLAEARYFLGGVALSRGLLVESERHYEQAWEAIPESPQIAISLASVAFAEEDFERSLEFYEKTLALVPDYREAILGKAISLTYLGRNAEAMLLAEDLLRRGKYFLGEAHFWLAWNQHELGRNEEAAGNIDSSKKLMGVGQVYSLAGRIRLGLGDEDVALREFEESLKYNSHDGEVYFEMGGIFARRHGWDKSGSYYQKSGECYEAQAAEIEDKVLEIRGSTLPEARKDRLVRRKTAQLDLTRLSCATAYYNAAAEYLNAGDPGRALPCGLKAASHPDVKVKAEELVRKIRLFPRSEPGLAGGRPAD